MYGLIRPLVFKLDPELAHGLTLSLLDISYRFGLSRLLAPKRISDPITVMGIQFPNRLGLAAGLDKNGDHINGLGALGFGFVEIGTITPKAQPGNDKPRLFRLVEEQAIINRMGFNNGGVKALVANVKAANFSGILGINIGKNKDTPAEQALDDYTACMDEVYPYADYITVNLSSPNTPGLRDLQFGEPLEKLLAGIKQRQHELTESVGKYVPVAVKIAPDMALDDLSAVADAFKRHQIDAVIATNTTIDKSEVSASPYAEEAGGLSGAPLTDKSTLMIRALAKELDGAMPIIGVGGVYDGLTAQQKITAGADLVQVYSGLIYQGPKLVAEAAQAIADLS